MSAYDFIEERFCDPNIGLEDIIKLMEDYAAECIKASLEKASEDKNRPVSDEDEDREFKAMITNPKNIVLL